MFLILDDEINLSVSRLNAQTLPSVKGELSLAISELLSMGISFYEIIVQHGEMLSIDPETGSESTINKTDNVVNLARGARFTEVISILKEFEMLLIIEFWEVLPFVRIVTAVLSMLINVF